MTRTRLSFVRSGGSPVRPPSPVIRLDEPALNAVRTRARMPLSTASSLAAAESPIVFGDRFPILRRILDGNVRARRVAACAVRDRRQCRQLDLRDRAPHRSRLHIERISCELPQLASQSAQRLQLRRSELAIRCTLANAPSAIGNRFCLTRERVLALHLSALGGKARQDRI